MRPRRPQGNSSGSGWLHPSGTRSGSRALSTTRATSALTVTAVAPTDGRVAGGSGGSGRCRRTLQDGTMRPDTLLVHAGEPRPRDGGAVAMPIYQSSTFEETEGRGYHDIRYARLSNTPTHESLHAKLAALEEAEAALATASGMAAVSAALLSVLRAGVHVVAQDGLYGGTHDLLTRDLPRLGITVTFVSGDDPAAWRAAATPKTRVFYVEAL